jgi:octaprenyl-diphosphate synthase
LQLLNCNDADVTADTYLHVIHCKTAKLFEAAMRLGAILGKANPEQEAAAANFGMHLGTAFQLIDDVLDYSGDQETIGKSLGDDLAEGKPTLPLIFAMQHGTVEQAALIRAAIEQGDIEKFAEVLQIVQQTGALDYTRQQALREVDDACQALKLLPASAATSSMLELAKLAVSRQF